MKMLKVEWNDAAHYTERLLIKNADVLEPIKMVSIGFLMRETDQHLTLAQEYHEQIDFKDVMEPEPACANAFQIIPKGCITKITELTEVIV